MEAFYPDIRSIHIAAAVASGLLLLLRSVGWNLLGAQWPMAGPLRYLVYAVDTVLLTAAMMLMTITSRAPFATSWLTVKVLLLVVYVFLAWTALGRRPRNVRIGATIAAAAVFLFVVSIAQAHDPLGIFA